MKNILATTYSTLSNNGFIENDSQTVPKNFKNVINLSNYILNEKELEVLSLGLNFALPPSPNTNLMKNLKLKFISSIESKFKEEDIEEVEKEIIRNNVCKMIEQGRITLNKPNEISSTIKSLTSNKDIMIMKADKGNATVIMNTIDYHSKIQNLIEGPSSTQKYNKTQQKTYSKN